MQAVWRCVDVCLCVCAHACVLCLCVHVCLYCTCVYVCARVRCSRTGDSLSAGTRWGVIPLQVLWVAVRLDSEQMPCFPYSLALHLSRSSPEVFKVGGSTQALDLRMPKFPERGLSGGTNPGRAPGDTDNGSALLHWLCHPMPIIQPTPE